MGTDESTNRMELVRAIEPGWREPALEIARTLGDAGHRSWIVGGAVRDLWLAQRDESVAGPKDIDMVSAALPDQVEALFERTVPVGKAFGIVVVVIGGKEIEVATFREERGYSDRRRPDEIVYASSPDVDARRRDFTINALYLDPLNGEVHDPAGGLLDLEARVLRTVGDPADRFREDGLRILRMARFAARFGFEPAPGLLEAARDEGDSLGGVSPERVLDEMQKVLAGARPGEAVAMLDRVGAADRVLPGWAGIDGTERALRLAALGELERFPCDLAARFAALLGAEATEHLVTLRASRKLVQDAGARVDAAERWRALAAEPEGGLAADRTPIERGAIIEFARDPSAAPGADLALAQDTRVTALEETIRRVQRANEAAPAQPLGLTSKQWIELGIRPGPDLGNAHRAMGRASLGGAFTDEAGALAWAKAWADGQP